jgi:PIF1-like helicase
MVYGGLTDAASIWGKFGDVLCEGLAHTIRQKRLFCGPTVDLPNLDYSPFLIYQDLLIDDVDHELGPLGKYNLPDSKNDWGQYDDNPLIARELDHDRVRLAERANRRELQLNDDQRQAYEHIVASLRDRPEDSHFFLNSSGGTGKTFLYNTLCDRLRSEGKIVICVASTGIAAHLLLGGPTAHKRFKILIPIFDHSTCNTS